MKILLMNAPPESGKDAFARWLFGVDTPRENPIPGYCPHFERFSRPHKEAFAAMTGSKIDRFYNVEGYEERKNEIIPWLGVSYRQWQIDFSEKYMKPCYGKDIFTRMFYARAQQEEARLRAKGKNEPLFILADCGFDVELSALLEYGVPVEDVLLARIHRPGCSYKGDSRSYIYNKDVLSLDIDNNSTIDAYGARMQNATMMWLHGKAAFLVETYGSKAGDDIALENRIQKNGGC